MQAPFEEWREFWQPHVVGSPLVASVALLVLSTPAEATQSERTFSVAGTQSKRRGGGKLKRSTLSHLTLLKRVIRDRLRGRKRFERTKRARKSAPPSLASGATSGVFPVFAPPSASAVATPSAAAVGLPSASAATIAPAMDELTEEFNSRMEEEAEVIEALIVSGDLAFIVGEEGELSLLEQIDLEGLTAIDEADEAQVVDDDALSLDNLLIAFRGGAASNAVEIDDSAPEVPYL